jgi:hypothetical protein
MVILKGGILLSFFRELECCGIPQEAEVLKILPYEREGAVLKLGLHLPECVRCGRKVVLIQWYDGLGGLIREHRVSGKKAQMRLDRLTFIPFGGCGVYFIQGVSGGCVKIGYTTNIQDRLKTLQTGSPIKLKVLYLIEGATPEQEKELHKKFNKYHSHGEWFHPHPALLAYIEGLKNG